VRKIIPVLIALSVFMSATALAADNESGCPKHKHPHEWKNSAAAQLCRSQKLESDQQACFEQLHAQRKVAMKAFSESFRFKPVSATEPAQ
jgi:Spy/CpxP family protein refolding chaperone